MTTYNWQPWATLQNTLLSLIYSFGDPLPPLAWLYGGAEPLRLEPLRLEMVLLVIKLILVNRFRASLVKELLNIS